MKKKIRNTMVLVLVSSALLNGCSRAPETLAGTVWKITGLTALDGTEYDEAAYDAIIGATIYEFDAQGNLKCSVAGQETGIYSYVYEKGDLKISSEEMGCQGTVKEDVIKLKLGEEGEAVLVQQKN